MVSPQLQIWFGLPHLAKTMHDRSMLVIMHLELTSSTAVSSTVDEAVIETPLPALLCFHELRDNSRVSSWLRRFKMQEGGGNFTRSWWSVHLQFEGESRLALLKNVAIAGSFRHHTHLLSVHNNNKISCREGTLWLNNIDPFEWHSEQKRSTKPSRICG